MDARDAELLERAGRARDKLVEKFIHHPDVSLIDVGYMSEPGAPPANKITLRIHVSKRWFQTRPEARVAFPEEVDGVPVTVIPGEYRY